MKFGKAFELALEEENFPDEWVSASIKYKQLKKCINKVVKELSSLGLNASTLHLLVAGSDGDSNLNSDVDRPAHLQYEFEGNTKHFQPKILLTVDDNVVVSAGLSPTTRQTLEDLMTHQNQSPSYSSNKIEEITEEEESQTIQNGTDQNSQPAGQQHNDDITGDDEDELIFATDEDLYNRRYPSDQSKPSDDATFDDIIDQPNKKKGMHTIEITLRADSEFFSLLTKELEQIDNLQAKQKADLTSQVTDLGKNVLTVARPGTSSSASDLYAWREIFSLYRDAAIFFSTTERDHGSRNAEEARQRMQWFQQQLAKNPMNKQSINLLNDFMSINQKLIQSLLFQEMNTTATQKILKKFDKRTSLTARSTFPEFMSTDPFFADSLARAICYVISENLLTIIPDIDDYTCPVCASITYKPECSHVFCIRCLVMLQRQKKANCPICRAEVVLKADSENIDESLLRFLKMYFPRETKAKQLENERAAGMDQLTAAGFGKGQGNCVIS